jgi:hypothetical protein
MKNLLKVEELLMLVLSVVVYQSMGWDWYWYWVWFLVPDVGMLGYLFNTRIGAFTYNLTHHKAVAIAIGLAGFFFQNPLLFFTGNLLFGHSAFDRIAGYGLKYPDSFNNTHLGLIGKSASEQKA